MTQETTTNAVTSVSAGANSTVEIEGYRKYGTTTRWHKVRFFGRLVYETESYEAGDEVYLTASGTFVVRWARSEEIATYGTFIELSAALVDAQLLSGIADELGIDYVEEIE
jgi:hypothetical protein